MTKKRKRAAGAGRKPAGQDGSPSSTYPSVRIAPDALEALKPIAAAKGVAIWVVMTEAARLYIKKAQQPRKA